MFAPIGQPVLIANLKVAGAQWRIDSVDIAYSTARRLFLSAGTSNVCSCCFKVTWRSCARCLVEETVIFASESLIPIPTYAKPNQTTHHWTNNLLNSRIFKKTFPYDRNFPETLFPSFPVKKFITVSWTDWLSMQIMKMKNAMSEKCRSRNIVRCPAFLFQNGSVGFNRYCHERIMVVMYLFPCHS